MKILVNEYCRVCEVCQDLWVVRTKSHKELASLLIFTNSWKQISINFVTDLLTSINIEEMKFNIILVIMNWLSKMTHFIFIWKNLTTEKLAYFIVHKVVRIHELLLKIVTDHESLFMTEFWSDLMYILKITWDLSTAYHSQTDDQTEQFNSMLKQYLQSYINYNQNN